LARYAPNEVREDADKQHLFLKRIYYDLCLQLKGNNNYANFQELVNKAIMLDNEHQEMDRKRKMKGQGSGNNARQRTNSQHGFHQRFQGPVSQWNRNSNQ
jgi:membrane-bound lytic murein transglycosylase MltF